MTSFYFFIRLGLISALIMVISLSGFSQTRIYVDSAALGSNNGTSWNDAYLKLEDALNVASMRDTIWVAKSTYNPVNSTDAVYNLNKGIQLYGGFRGDEINLTDRSLHPDSLHRANRTVLSGAGNSSRVMVAVNQDSSLTVDGFIIKDGTNPGIQSPGGAIYCYRSPLKIKNCQIINNQSTFNGGGIFVFQSAFSLENCLVSGNKSDASGGGLFFEDATNISINNCQIIENESEAKGGGIYSTLSPFEVKNSQIEDNLSKGNGGGFYAFGSVFTLDSSRVVGNKSDSSSGGGLFFEAVTNISLNNCQIIENESGGEGGGGVSVKFGNSVFENCILKKNTALNPDSVPNYGLGGAILMENGFMSMKNCLIDSNKSQVGGGVSLFSGTLDIDNSGIVNNKGEAATGGLYFSGTVNITNSTISHNDGDSTNQYGAITVYGNLNLKGCTLFGNSINGIKKHNITLRNSGEITLSNTLIGGSEPDEMDIHTLIDLGRDSGEWVSAGHNMISAVDTQAVGFNLHTTDVIGTINDPIDLKVGELGYYGGIAPTNPLLANSPALGKGEPINATDLLIDQRGFSRFIGSSLDSISIGAFERKGTIVQYTPQSFCENSIRNKLGEIIMIDVSGGAWAPGDSLTLELIIPDAFKLKNNNNLTANCYGDGVSNCNAIVVNDSIFSISYTRTFTTSPDTIKISGLTIKSTSKDSLKNYIYRHGGTAIQWGNQVEDSVIHGELFILPIVKGPLEEESFDNDNKGDWISIDKNPLWDWGKPNGETIKDSTARVWMTGLNTTKYQTNEYAILNTTCFDLSEIKKPIMGFDLWMVTDEHRGTLKMEHSIDGGDTWSLLELDSTNSLDGYESQNPVLKGWTGRYENWQKPRYSLDTDTLQDSTFARFRFVFESDSSTVLDFLDYDGAAIDNFSIKEGRVPIVEIVSPDSGDFNRLFQGDDNIQVLTVIYEIDTSQSLFKANPIGPAVRSEYYGISEFNQAVLQGNQFLDSLSSLTRGDLARATLNVSAESFKFTFDSSQSKIQSLSSFTEDEEINVMAAILEKGVESDGKTYPYVFRKFLPDPAGMVFWGWEQNSIKEFTFKWDEESNPQPSKSLVDNYDSLVLLVFVQNRKTKEIYQSELFDIWPELVDPESVKRRAGLSPPSDGSFSAYPNPTSNTLFVNLNSDSDSDYQWQMLDMNGRQVLAGSFSGSKDQETIVVESLAGGIYYLDVRQTGVQVYGIKVLKR